MSADLGIQDIFPAPGLDAWRALVERDLKGAPFEKRLLASTDSELLLQPLYSATDWAPSGSASQPPGFGDRTRGATPLSNALRGWTVACDVAATDPHDAVAAVTEACAGGATGVNLTVPATWGFEDLHTALGPVSADTWLTLRSDEEPLRRAAQLVASCERRGLDPTRLRGCFAADPLSTLAVGGDLPEPYAQRLSQAAGLAVYAQKACPGMRAIEVGAHVYHEAGAGVAQELAFGLAAGLEVLRELTAPGLLDVDAACAQMTIGLSLDQDFLLGVAKLRAARRLWSRAIEVCGGSQGRLPPLVVRTGRRMSTARAPWVNVLRATTAAFAAAVGGADVLTVLPFDAPVGASSPRALRLSRNTQLILQREAHLHRVVDPAGGAYAFERITDDLAAEAWGLLQQVEARGGLAAALLDGWVQARVAETRAARQERVAKRECGITGVSLFPHLGEEPLKLTPLPPSDAVVLGGAPPIPPKHFSAKRLARGGRCSTGGRKVTRAVPALATPGDTATPSLPPHRLSEPFERLRDRSDAVLAATGARPRVFLACLGKLADHSARSTWTANLLAGGGIEAVGIEAHTTVGEVTSAFRRSGARAAVLCSTDALYAEHAGSLAGALRDAGALRVALAGHPRSHREAYESAGVDAFVHVGVDVLAFLRALWEVLA